MDNFRDLLWNVCDAYDDFVAGVVSYVKLPGNETKRALIENYIKSNPDADTSAITRFILDETDFWETRDDRSTHGMAKTLAFK